MRLKKNKGIKNKTISIRVSEKEFNKLKIKASLYTESNISEWLIFAGLEHRPTRSDLE